jgi:BASS family bile acid:Na+ symporter
VLNVIAPPVFSTPIFVALMGLEPALALAAVIACAAATPFTASAFAALFIGAALPLSPPMLALRLGLMLGGTALAAALVRGIAGHDRIRAQRERIDGLQVIAMVVFGLAAMDGVTAQLVARPQLAAGIVALGFTMTIALMFVTALVFRRHGRHQAIALGIASAGRNMGLMIAAAGGAIPDLAWLYFALAQIPIYLLPLMFKPFARLR